MFENQKKDFINTFYTENPFGVGKKTTEKEKASNIQSNGIQRALAWICVPVWGVRGEGKNCDINF